MMKLNTVLCFYILFGFVLGPAQASSNYYFIEAKKYQEISGLPPQLKVTFDLRCNEEFVRVIRDESMDPKTGETQISVGVLVKENMLSACAGVAKEMTVAAGNTFSGRRYSVSLIKSQRP